MIADQMGVARAVQEQLLPPPVPEVPGLELAVRFLPSRAVGGDFCDYFRLNSRYLGLYVGDVQGKGLEGAMYALLVCGLMRGITKTGHEPAEVVGFLNQRLSFRALPGKFSCLLYALFDLEQRHMVLTNAGLPFPFLLRGDTLTRVEAAGLPLGLFKAADYEQAALSLQPGDQLLFFSDGLTDSLEALHPRRGDGAKQVQALLARHAGAPADELAELFVNYLRAARHQRRQKEITDDATFLFLRVL